MPKSYKINYDNKNSQAQSSISKYFSVSTTKHPRSRKRSSTEKFECAITSKNSKLEFIPHINEIFSEAKSSFKNDSESSNENFKKESNISECTKNKLSLFSYKKECKIEGNNTFHKEISAKIQATNEVKDLLSFDETNSIEKEDLDSSSAQKSIKYTPLEKQYLEFQAKYPDAVLLIECGYKYRFFGKDAEIANKDLNIGCYQYHNFLSASIPVYRLHFHIRRLVLKGHKVGVIKQIESAALKAAGETRNELFSRELHTMYTKSTFIDGDLSALDDEKNIKVGTDSENDIGSSFLMCINESQSSVNPSCDASIAFVAIQICSGDIIYSSFQNSLKQNELESCLVSINPSEILVPSSILSKTTETLLKAFIYDRCIRIERINEKKFDKSLNTMSSFISNDQNYDGSADDIQDNLQSLLLLPSLVVSCLSALKSYLFDFKMEHILRNVKNMKPFSANDNMVLNAATLRGLEILHSSCNPSHHRTLMWSLNRTSTKFGERLLRSWVVKPLKDIQKIEERLNIVNEIMSSESTVLKKISSILHKLPDLERLLCSAFYHKCNCFEFLKLVTALTTIKNEFVTLSDKITTEIEVLKLKSILLNIIKCLNGIEKFSSNINPEAAKSGNKIDLFFDGSKYKSMETSKLKISVIEKKLNNLRPSICRILHIPAFKYATVSGQKFLIEVPKSHESLVPSEWLKINVTKQVSRFRSPEVISLCTELDQEQERLLKFAVDAWDKYLDEFGEEFYKFKNAILHLAELDCYFSLATVSKDELYCRPVLTDSENRNFFVQQGRHPVAVKLMGEENQFVANDAKLNNTERCLIVTGPNMGGKSTYVRQIAVIALMAHIGCYVPAELATIPILDGIYVRMGAEDDIVSRKSTFMTEMSEASHILSSATAKSLVIFDELGRGTSTNDGTAIAYATLEYLIKRVQCFVLFVTHYPPVVELKQKYPENILTVHMSFILRDIDTDDIQTVIFLYHVVEGISEKSYGINVAALAGIHKDILIEAQKKSREMELKMFVQRKLQGILGKLKKTQNSDEIGKIS